MKPLFSTHPLSLAPGTERRGGFTLIEIMVAVSIMSLLLAIILVPLRLAFETYHIGTARTGLQQESPLILQQFSRDFHRADFVFPNTRIPGISDNTDTTSACSTSAYPSDGSNSPTDWKRLPYVRSRNLETDTNPATSGIGVTSPTSKIQPFSNPSRIDMLFLRKDTSKGVSARTGEDYVVSYYPRRLDITKPFDTIDNPVVLFRAQYPYRYRSTGDFPNAPATAPAPSGAINAQIDTAAYPAPLGSSSNSKTDRDFLWITHNYFGEANLEPLCVDVDADLSASPAVLDDVIASHTLVTPRGMQLVAPSAPAGGAGAYLPELSFVESSSDGKRIDRVGVNMTLAQYDQSGAAAANGQGKAQRLQVSQTFDLPNAGCSN